MSAGPAGPAGSAGPAGPVPAFHNLIAAWVLRNPLSHGVRVSAGEVAGASTVSVDSGAASAGGATSGTISGTAATCGGAVQASASKLSHLPQRGRQLAARVPQVAQIQAGSGRC